MPSNPPSGKTESVILSPLGQRVTIYACGIDLCPGYCPQAGYPRACGLGNVYCEGQWVTPVSPGEPTP